MGLYKGRRDRSKLKWPDQHTSCYISSAIQSQELGILLLEVMGDFVTKAGLDSL